MHFKTQGCLWNDILSDKYICQHEIMRRLLENQIPSRSILLGSPGSGKSTFLFDSNSRVVSGSLYEYHTDGIAISSVGNISFWEFGGQEVLFSTHQFFMSENAQYLLFVNLFELVNDDEFIKHQSETLTEYWMKEIKTFTKINQKHCPPVILIGTHCDKFGNKHSGIQKKQLAIDKLLQLASTYSIHYHKQVYELAKVSENEEWFANADANVREKSFWFAYERSVIHEILQQIRNHTTEYIRRDQGFSQSGDCSFAIQYLMAKRKIEKEKVRKSFMWWNEFKTEIFHPQNIHSEEYIWKLSQSLKNSGVIETHRFHSSGASDLVILDPIFLTGAFGSIITLNSSPKQKRGYFTLDEIENNFYDKGIEYEKELLFIFEMFHLIIKLPSGEYYVPGMIHSQSGNNMDHFKHEIQSKIFEFDSSESFQFIGRKYKFSPRIPFGFIERVIVRILHFPGMEIHPSSIVNNFYVFSEEGGNYNNRNFHIFIHLDNETEKEDDSILKISIYYPREEENNFYCLFFFHVIFQSPHEVLYSFLNSNSSIDKTILLNHKKQEIGTEIDLVMNFKFKNNQKYICGNDIQVFESDKFHCKFIKYLDKINDKFVWIGEMNLEALTSNKQQQVIFKEPISINFENIKGMVNEIMLLKMIENEFTLKLIGICFPSRILLSHRNKLETSNQMIGSNSEEDFLNHQMLMIVEKSPFGSLADCFEEIKACSVHLKLKIAFDIARGMNILFLKSGMKIIHRNIKPENIFIFSMDEHSTLEINSIHAKLGDLGRSVVGIPFYFQPLNDDDFRYTAPEALKGSSIVPYSQSIDVYSFGILLWQLLSGKIPFYELENDITKQIIEGHRPSIDDLPSDISEEIIQMIECCWNSNPKQRIGFEKIISILSPYFKGDFKFSNNVKFQKMKYKASTAKNLKIKKKIIGKNISVSFFSKVQYVGNGCDGLVMICDFHLENKIFQVALKMLMEFHGDEISGTNHRKKINEFNILSDDIQHPNIICKFGSFISVPSDDMIINVDAGIRDLCFDQNNPHTKKKHQFYILEAYRRTLQSVIGSLPLHQIVKYSYQLSSALLFLYNKNIVHLDVKADNLMISFNDDLVMIDFGHAAQFDENGFIQINDGLFDVGNRLHLSPEILQAVNEQRNLPCKLQHSWELGMILYEMFHQGNPPFEYYVPSAEATIDFSKIPTQFRELIPKLLCLEKERISIESAYNQLKNIFNDYEETETEPKKVQKTFTKAKGIKNKTTTKKQSQKKKKKIPNKKTKK